MFIYLSISFCLGRGGGRGGKGLLPPKLLSRLTSDAGVGVSADCARKLQTFMMTKLRGKINPQKASSDI